MGDWRRLHNEELHNSKSSSNIIWMINSKRMGWAAHVACMIGMKNAYKILVGKPEWKTALGRHVCM
jgi:hypothetical protein